MTHPRKYLFCSEVCTSILFFSQPHSFKNVYCISQPKTNRSLLPFLRSGKHPRYVDGGSGFSVKSVVEPGDQLVNTQRHLFLQFDNDLLIDCFISTGAGLSC